MYIIPARFTEVWLSIDSDEESLPETKMLTLQAWYTMPVHSVKCVHAHCTGMVHHACTLSVQCAWLYTLRSLAATFNVTLYWWTVSQLTMALF